MCIFAFSSDEIISEDNYFRRQLFNMKRLLFAIFCLLTALNMKADKAYPFPVEVVQQDGTTLTIVQHGDEYFHYVTTVDGVLLVPQLMLTAIYLQQINSLTMPTNAVWRSGLW